MTAVINSSSDNDEAQAWKREYGIVCEKLIALRIEHDSITEQCSIMFWSLVASCVVNIVVIIKMLIEFAK